MQLCRYCTLYVVGKDGRSEMRFHQLVNAIKGGLDLNEVEVFTTIDEAKVATLASERRKKINDFGADTMLRASKLALMDESGAIVAHVDFCPID